MPSKFEGICTLTYTAWCLPTCLVRSPSIARLPQLCQTRRCHFNPMSPKFLPCRPQWAEAKRTQGLVFGAAGRKCQSSRRASPVIGGPGGVVTMNTRLWRGVRRSHTPWRIFGYFLCEQKVTPASPIKKMNLFPLTSTQKTDKIFWQIRKTAWKRKSTRL